MGSEMCIRDRNAAERIRLRLTVPRTSSKHAPKLMAAQTIEAALQTEHHMDEKDLEFLGGVEYRALKLLRLIVLCVRTIAFVHNAMLSPTTVSHRNPSFGVPFNLN